MLMAVAIPETTLERILLLSSQFIQVGGWTFGLISLIAIWYIFTRLKPFLPYIKCKRNPEELAFLKIDTGNEEFYRAARIKLGSLETKDMGTYRIDAGSARHIKGVTSFTVYSRLDITLNTDVAAVTKKLWDAGMSWREWDRIPEKVEYYICGECGVIEVVNKSYDNDQLQKMSEYYGWIRNLKPTIRNYYLKLKADEYTYGPEEEPVSHCGKPMNIEVLTKKDLEIDMGHTVDVSKVRDVFDMFGDPNVDQLRGENMLLAAKTEALSLRGDSGKWLVYGGILIFLTAIAYITIKPYLACEAAVAVPKAVIPMIMVPRGDG